MSAYTAAITAQILVAYPGASVLDQSRLLVLGEAVAAMVIPAEFADQRLIEIETYIATDPIFNQMPKNSASYEYLLQFCEFCLDLAITANTPAGGSAIGMYAVISQVAAAPVFDAIIYNTFGELPVFGDNGAGDFDLNLPTTAPFTNPDAVKVTWFNLDPAVNVKVTVLAPNQLGIIANLEESDIATGIITGTPTDGILTGVGMQIEILS